MVHLASCPGLVTAHQILQAANKSGHLCNVVLAFDALLELATQAVLVVHHGVVQLQPCTAELAHSVPHLLHCQGDQCHNTHKQPFQSSHA